MTSLEKAAIAAAEVVRQQKDSSLHFDGMAIARAVLLAVREPDGFVIDKGSTHACGLPEAEATWKRMIDAILLEKGDG